MQIRRLLTMQSTSFFMGLINLLISSGAFAEVYKCTVLDADTHKSTVTYSDAPCAKSAQQTVTDIPVAGTAPPVPTQTQTDLRVKQAILNGDFDQAKSLATTSAHWQSIATAEAQAKAAASEPVLAAEPDNNSRADCVNAQAAFDYAVRNQWRDRELVAAKKSIMQAACGVGVDATQASPLVVESPYAGIRHTRQILFPYGYGQVGPGRLGRPYPPKPHHGSGNKPGAHGSAGTSKDTRGSVGAQSFGVDAEKFGTN